MSSDVVVVSGDGPVVTIRINRPRHENRLNLAVLDAIVDALRHAEENTAVRVVVLTGTGDTFCCGGDVAEFALGDAAAYHRFARGFAAVHLAVVGLTKPVLAAVNGDVRAGGMSLLSVCDLAVARASVRFAMPEIRDGLWPIMAMVSLNRALPRKRAFELYYFGEPFDVEQARNWGLVNTVVPDEEFEPSVESYANRLARLPARSVAMGRATFDGIAQRGYADGFAYSGERLVELLTNPEIVRALAGRKEKP